MNQEKTTSVQSVDLYLVSRDLSQAHKKVTVVKPEQVHKMTIISNQKLSS